ncbi:hypothetical protein L6164_018717 [Bauhinia variegata]|uniref:Uncharacterized protein n=1 Tax=Bauhinia variegata TaxID=167791 RepID=A0ACB9NBX0_BAUVA|nr:hypothetical protein L6164_018717 [Bauhinia variegata]
MSLIRSKWSLHYISRLSGSLFYSTEALPPSSPAPVDPLIRRISRARDPRIPVTRELDQWVQEGRHVTKSQLRKFITILRNSHRLRHALQVSEWMSNKENHELTSGDIAVRLDLISKVHGLDEAERYYASIPETSRVVEVYGALLNCYAEHQSLEKAEATIQKIREFGVNRALSYNVMLKLYAQMGQYEKMDSLMQEMEEKGICDGFTINIRLNAYANTSDLKGMEKFLMQTEADGTTLNWFTYASAANCYLKAGLSDKSLEMLKKSELFIKGNVSRIAYESLLTKYAAIGSKEDVYRIWIMYKNLGKSNNSGYISMLSSLVKLDDIEGAERILEEWESGYAFFDIRIPNMLISAYCKKGLLEKAEALISKILESGNELDGRSWDSLATYYCRNNLTESAVEVMKKAILAYRPSSKVNPFNLSACIEYLKGKGDSERALDILKLCRERSLFSEGTYNELFHFVHVEKPDTSAFHLMAEDHPMEKIDQASDAEKRGEMELSN